MKRPPGRGGDLSLEAPSGAQTSVLGGNGSAPAKKHPHPFSASCCLGTRSAQVAWPPVGPGRSKPRSVPHLTGSGHRVCEGLTTSEARGVSPGITDVFFSASYPKRGPFYPQAVWAEDMASAALTM